MAIVRKYGRRFASIKLLEEKASEDDLRKYHKVEKILDDLASRGVIHLTRRNFTEKVRDVEAEVTEILLCFDTDEWLETTQLMSYSGLDRETVIARCLELARRGILDKRLPDSNMRPGSGNGYSFKLLSPPSGGEGDPKPAGDHTQDPSDA